MGVDVHDIFSVSKTYVLWSEMLQNDGAFNYNLDNYQDHRDNPPFTGPSHGHDDER